MTEDRLVVEHNETDREKARLASLLSLFPGGYRSLLDVGTRDGYILQHLVPRFEAITALDLKKPAFRMERVTCVQGDASQLEFPDNCFDVVLCSEVLEHIPPRLLSKACHELARVARHRVVIGVPYLQDLRVDRVTCSSCGAHVHAWGHVNTFDENRLQKLFAGLKPLSVELIEKNSERTNALSAYLLDRAGNPWGAYDRGQECSQCGAPLITGKQRRTVLHRTCAAAGYFVNRLQRPFVRPAPTWIHMVFEKCAV